MSNFFKTPNWERKKKKSSHQKTQFAMRLINYLHNIHFKIVNLIY